MLKSRKNVFWEALMVTVVLFLAGLLFGIYMENNNSDKIEQFYTQSEISLTDTMAFSSLSEDMDFDCDIVKKANLDLANKVYEEALLLEKYEESSRITGGMKLLHKKYDLLRSLIWASNQKSFERCNNYNVIVYLYEYNTEDIKVKAKQNVWSKILLEFKESFNEDTLLLPIAGDQNLTSLDLLMNEYGVTQLPTVIINNEHILYDLDNAEQIKNIVDKGESFNPIVLN